MSEIEDFVLAKDKQNSVADTYRGTISAEFRTGEKQVTRYMLA